MTIQHSKHAWITREFRRSTILRVALSLHFGVLIPIKSSQFRGHYIDMHVGQCRLQDVTCYLQR